MPQEHAAGIVIDMTPDKALAALDKLLRDREAGEAAVKATPGAIVEALKAGVTAAEIARRLKMSEGYVRKFRREAKLQDQRYAHVKPPPRPGPAQAEPEPLAELSALRTQASAPTEEDLPSRFRKLTPRLADEIVDRIRLEYPTWHIEARELVADVTPSFQNLAEIKLAFDAGVLDDLGITLP